MLFNSLHFALYLPVVLILFFAAPQRWKRLVLLAASAYFYMAWRPEYIAIVLFTSLIDYVAAILIRGTERETHRRAYLLLSLSCNLLILFAFKYSNFFLTNVRAVLGVVGIPFDPPILSILLPVGISFHTFQAMGYAIDVYRRRIEPERDLGVYVLFVIFFPQLVAGPIERAAHMIPQLHRETAWDEPRFLSGIKLMAWGLFKKVVVADRLAVFVDEVYDHPHRYSGLPLVLATVFFAFQIYCDFSGYSDMAVGSAEIMGFRLMQNFDRPYQATSVAEFWRRWHISLSTWFRDYVYLPLGGSRCGPSRWFANLLVTFLLSGLWHGASWNFVIWGALNGLYVALAVVLGAPAGRLARGLGLDRAPSLSHAARVLGTFGLVATTWVFFRARTLGDALYVFTHAGTEPSLASRLLEPRALVDELSVHQGGRELALAIAAIVALLVVEHVQRGGPIRERLGRQPAWVRYTVYYAVGFSLLLFGRFESRQFIYFQF